MGFSQHKKEVSDVLRGPRRCQTNFLSAKRSGSRNPSGFRTSPCKMSVRESFRMKIADGGGKRSAPEKPVKCLQKSD